MFLKKLVKLGLLEFCLSRFVLVPLKPDNEGVLIILPVLGSINRQSQMLKTSNKMSRRAGKMLDSSE